MDEAIRRLFQQEERLRELAKGPLGEYERQQEQMRQLAASYNPLLIADTVKDAIAGFTSAVSAVTAAQKSIAELVRPNAIAESMNFLRAEGWQDITAAPEIINPHRQVEEVMRSLIEQARQYTGATAAAISSMIFDNAPFPGMPALRDFSTLTANYESLFAGIGELEGKLAGVPRFVIELPPRDMRIKTEIIESFGLGYEPESARSVIDDPVFGCDDVELMLDEYDPSLLMMLHGARDAMKENGGDKVRHVCVSLRELCTHVLLRLSPDDDIRRWQPDLTASGIYDKGKATRLGRLSFICRFVNFGLYAPYLAKSMRTTIDFFGMLQEGTHAVTPEASDAQLQMILRDAVGVLRFLLTTAKNRP